MAFHGYIFGGNDLVEVLPYALYLNDTSLYPHDFFIQHISTESINERILIAKLLAVFGGSMEYVAALLHAVCSMSLLLGLYKIAQRYILNEVFIWGFLLLTFFPLYNINLGGNELYYNMFVSSTFAKGIAVWAVYFFLEKAWTKAYGLISLIAFIQPIVGAQLFILFTGVAIVGNWFGFLTVKWSKLIGLTVLFLLTAGIWLVTLKLSMSAGMIDQNLFMEIIEFRLPHHFFPSYYSKKNALVLLPLFLIGLYYFRKADQQLFWFFIIALIGLPVFVIGVEVLLNSTVVATQWFKTTIWLKAFSVLALMALLEKSKIGQKTQSLLQRLLYPSLVLLAVFSIGIIYAPFSVFKKRPYDFFFASKTTPEVQIALMAKEKTPKNAVFVLPVEFSAFKYHSQRSSYVDYKTIIHRNDAFQEWYQKVKTIYKVDIKTRRSGKDPVQVAAQNYAQLDVATINNLAQNGVTHLVMPIASKLNYPLITENEAFAIYKISNK